MKELQTNQNIFEIVSKNPDATAICVTTNAMTRYNGNAIMGKGVALEARNRFPFIERTLGKLLRTKGNHTHHIGFFDNYHVITFPTKHD